MKYDKQALINARAHDLASDGGFQHEVAEDGMQSIDTMTDTAIKAECDYYGLDYDE